MPNDSEMSGSATLTMVPSSPSRNIPSAMVARSSMWPLYPKLASSAMADAIVSVY